ncbi:hypothetical protein [Dactylosporangium sp. CA-139066]
MNLLFSLAAFACLGLSAWTLIRGGRGAAGAAFMFFFLAFVLAMCALNVA